MPQQPLTYTPEKLVHQRILPLICGECAISVAQGVESGRVCAKTADALSRYLGLQAPDILMSGTGCRNCHLGHRGREVYHEVEFGGSDIEVFDGVFRLVDGHPSQDAAQLMPLALAQVAQGKFCITHVEAALGKLPEWIENYPSLTRV